jgi:3-deoxy-7-phosphoheptulonate synthase
MNELLDPETLGYESASAEVVSTLPPPQDFTDSLPVRGTTSESLIASTRRAIHRILHGLDDRLLTIIGPCSIHDPQAALEYAQRLRDVRHRLSSTLAIVMRVYCEKPRTTVGWKGLINDPHLNGSFRIDDGLRIARRLLMDINELGVPVATEFLDVISPRYLGDLISWGAIGARTTESQVHRELASSLPVPIGFKNGTDGDVHIAADAVQAAARGHHFLSISASGRAAVVKSGGNKTCHVVLRGGRSPNYDAESVAQAVRTLKGAGVPARVMIDCSHGNSRRQHGNQLSVAADVACQIASGSPHILGIMAESHLTAGAQRFAVGIDDPRNLEYGKSITDACLGWDDSLDLLDRLSSAVAERRLASDYALSQRSASEANMSVFYYHASRT